MFKRALCLLALGAQLASAQVNVAAAALVPAYIYPETDTTWQPLYTQITNNPSIQFNVIINPASGPGTDALPDSNYEREILKLRDFTNVRLVGYVAVNYTNKALSLVEAEVAKYASWPATAANPALGVDGIFFDEAPSDAAAAKLSYIQSATTHTRSFAANGLGASPYVVTNPGSPPDRAYLYSPSNSALAPDLALVYEEAYATWTANQAAVADAIRALGVDDGALAVVLHDVPEALACADVTALVDAFKSDVGVGTLWLTDDADYQVWPEVGLWERALKAFASGGDAC